MAGLPGIFHALGSDSSIIIFIWFPNNEKALPIVKRFWPNLHLAGLRDRAFAPDTPVDNRSGLDGGALSAEALGVTWNFTSSKAGLRA
jgi:hypothetical protein